MVPIYATVSFLSYLYYNHSVYFEVVRDCYEAFAIASFFSLLCHYIAPDLHSQKDYFRSIQPRSWVWPLSWLKRIWGGDHGPWRTPRSGLTWFNVRNSHHMQIKNPELIVLAGNMDGSFPILFCPGLHDWRCGCYSSCGQVLPGVFEPRICTYMGMLQNARA